MSNNEDFKFTRGDLVRVVDFGEQCSMTYKAMGELLSEAHDEPFLAYPITIGGSLRRRNYKEGEEVFRVVSCGYLRPRLSTNTKIYLLASEEELVKYKDKNCEERYYYSFPVYVVAEQGLGELEQKVFLVEFLPKTSRNDFFIVGVNCTDGEYQYLLAGKRVKRGEVVEDFSGSNPKTHRLLVYVTAKDENEAQEKGAELFKKHLIGKMNRLSEERGDVEWRLSRLNERMEVDDE